MLPVPRLLLVQQSECGQFGEVPEQGGHWHILQKGNPDFWRVQQLRWDVLADKA
jgi:hypothetical protein